MNFVVLLSQNSDDESNRHAEMEVCEFVPSRWVVCDQGDLAGSAVCRAAVCGDDRHQTNLFWKTFIQ